MQVEASPGFSVAGEQLKLFIGPLWPPVLRANVNVSLAPLAVAVKVPLTFDVTVPTDAAKLAEVSPAGITTFDVVCRRKLLLESATVTGLPAALFIDTVQVALALLLRVAGKQDSEVSCAGAAALSVKLWEPPFRLAVSRAD